jgi:hypothetical protein
VTISAYLDKTYSLCSALRLSIVRDPRSKDPGSGDVSVSIVQAQNTDRQSLQMCMAPFCFVTHLLFKRYIVVPVAGLVGTMDGPSGGSERWSS